MPVITYSYTDKDIDDVRNLLMEMDAELGFLISNIDNQKALDAAGLLSRMQRQLQDKLGIEF